MVANVKSDLKYQTDQNELPKDVPKVGSSELAHKKQLNQVVDGIREVKIELKPIKKFIGKEELKRSPEGAIPSNSKGSTPNHNEGSSPNYNPLMTSESSESSASSGEKKTTPG